jgi:hypothetical protein
MLGVRDDVAREAERSGVPAPDRPLLRIPVVIVRAPIVICSALPALTETTFIESA